MTIDELITLVRSHEDLIFLRAQERGIDPLTLRSQLLLHLPRGGDFQQELDAACDIVSQQQRPYADWLKPPEQPITLDDLEFGPLDDITARIYHERFHYVGSYRPGVHFALWDKNSGRIVCMGSIATFDLKHVEEKIPLHIGLKSLLVFSRFFAFRWAPKNTFSYFWGKLRQHLIKELDTSLMFSFINPNLGFDACSHKAAQWVLFATEEGTRYIYLDGRYQTMRYVLSNPDKSFEVSTMDLKPLLILANPLQRRAQRVIPATPYLFKRPSVVIGQSHSHAITTP